jgi:hypothetical protein
MEKMSFKEFVNPGAFQNTAQMGMDNQFFGVGHSLNLPTPTLEIPTKTVGGRISRINYTQNPISIYLTDGTVWNLSKKQWNYLLATNKEPKINGKVQIEVFLDGTIKSVNCNYATRPQRDYVREDVPASHKPEKIFGRRLPF